MIRAVLATLILLGTAACGTNNGSSLKPPTAPSSADLEITWTGDGNPLVPICGADLVNCKSSLTVHDDKLNTDAVLPLPVISNAYSAPNPADTYEVRVNGYNGQGLPISSPYEAVPVAK